MNLTNWLDRIKATHVKEMDLSLERVSLVAKRLNLLNLQGTIITVGGTNGKGSTVAGLESIYLTAGYRVGAFTSPILFRHNEYIRIQGKDVTDELLIKAFEWVERARSDIPLTPFEFTSLAAFICFAQSDLDIVLLEVGLGGRFDAVNVLDADVAIVTSIGIDHTEWLGDTREKIAFEKAGIFRKNKPAICGDNDPPITLIQAAKEVGSSLYLQNKDFGFDKNNFHWGWWSKQRHLHELPLPKLALSNMSCVLMAIELLQAKHPVSDPDLREGLLKANAKGRIQVVVGEMTQVFDVSHNADSVKMLANWLRDNPISGKTHGVFSMLADKDILGSLTEIKECIDSWHISTLDDKRAASIELLLNSFRRANITNSSVYDSIQKAHAEIMQKAQPADRIIIFGSFHTVAAVMNVNPTQPSSQGASQAIGNLLN